MTTCPLPIERLPQRLPWWVAVLLLAGGCATTPAPVEQIKYFAQAFAAVDTVGQPLLDDLAIAERSVGRRLAVQRAKDSTGTGPCSAREAPWAVAAGDARLGFIDGFCVDDASTFSELGDPRATAQLRAALHIIERYAALLTTLAEGGNVDDALAQVDALGQEVGALLALTGAQVALTPALAALRPLLADVARQANAQEARRSIIEAAPRVSELIAALRQAVPSMFKELIADARRASDAPATVKAAVEQIEARRRVVSQYVVLLERLQSAWDATVLAARHPGGSRLALLVARTAELRSDAEAVRRSLALLRAGPQP